MTEPPKDAPSIATGSETAQLSGVTFNLLPRVFNVHYVSATELDALASGYSSANATLLGLAFGVFVAVLLVILTVDLSDREMAVMTATCVVTALLSVFFAFTWLRERSRVSSELTKIKQRAG